MISTTTTAALTTAVNNVMAAIAVWGPKGNRGSHVDLADLRAKTLTLAQLLKAEAQYVQNTAQTAAGSDYVLMGAVITTSGFQLASISGFDLVAQRGSLTVGNGRMARRGCAALPGSGLDHHA